MVYCVHVKGFSIDVPSNELCQNGDFFCVRFHAFWFSPVCTQEITICHCHMFKKCPNRLLHNIFVSWENNRRFFFRISHFIFSLFNFWAKLTNVLRIKCVSFCYNENKFMLIQDDFSSSFRFARSWILVAISCFYWMFFLATIQRCVYAKEMTNKKEMTNTNIYEKKNFIIFVSIKYIVWSISMKYLSISRVHEIKQLSNWF